MNVVLLAAGVTPARGTPIADLVPATICGLLGLMLVAAMAVGHRRGAFKSLAWLSDKVEQRTGIPGWSAIPGALTAGALLIAAFGYYWDVSWHIDRGRDPGPFANPAHWFIIVGLAGIAFAGVLAIILGDQRETGASFPFRPGWNVPVGGILLTVCGVVALAGFPLDDVWHRIFGQDVTAWGPTHIQMIAGASLATLAAWTLGVEGQRVAAAEGRPVPPRVIWVQNVVAGGAFLMGLSTLQVEFDFGVPQFRQVNHPLLIMLAATIGLVAVRIRGGRGAALASALFFVGMRAGLAFAIDPLLGRSLLHFPLYLAEALLVEVIARVITTHDPIRFGLACGLAIGTLGLGAEWAWSHVFMPLPWHAALFPEGAIVGFIAALGGGVIGAAIGRSLSTTAEIRRVAPRYLAALAGAAAVLCIAWSLPTQVAPVTAAITVDNVARTDGRWGNVTVQLTPADAARNARWFNALAWQGRRQGDGGLVIAQLRQVGNGVYRTAEPIPMFGTWKTLLRLQRGKSLEALPIYLPADPAIPAAGVATGAHATRSFVREKQILQREAVGGSIALQRLAYAVLGGIGVLWIASIAWGLRRLDRARRGESDRGDESTGPGPSTPRPTRRRVGAHQPASAAGRV